MSDLEKLKQLRERAKFAKESVNKTRLTEYQVDTVSVETKGSGAYYSSSTNSITLQHREGENADVYNAYYQSTSTKIHEQKHKDDFQAGMFTRSMSPSQVYKNKHNLEIAANIAELIALRDQYIKTGDIEPICSSKFGFYADAVVEGQIEVNSKDPAKFDEEMRLIANGTKELWMDNYVGQYHDVHMLSAYNHVEKFGIDNVQANDKNYEIERKIAYTIGGVDFTQYMDKDVQAPKKLMHVEKLMANGVDNEVSLEQWADLNRHQIFVDNLRDEMRNMDETQKKWIMEEEYFQKFVDEKDKDNVTDKVFKKAYLRMSMEIETHNSNFDYLKDAENIVLATKVTIPKANDEIYNKRLREIYKIDGVDYFEEAKGKKFKKSEAVEKFSNKSFGSRMFQGYIDFAGNTVGLAKIKRYFHHKSQTDSPEYREWSPDVRVSKPIKEEILDTRQAVIEKPSKVDRFAELTGANSSASMADKLLELRFSSPVSTTVKKPEVEKESIYAQKARERLAESAGR